MSGVGSGNIATSNKTLNLHIESKSEDYGVDIDTIVLSKLTNYLPNEDIDIFKILGKKGVNIKLVDPLFYNPDKIDLIL